MEPKEKATGQLQLIIGMQESGLWVPSYLSS